MATTPGKFVLDDATTLLARTPSVLDALLRGVPDHWIRATEGGDTWSPFDVLGHLVHGERTDWMPRVRCVLTHGESKAFEPFDRTAQFSSSAGKTIDSLLDEFAELRRASLEQLRAAKVSAADLERRGRHPVFGPVTLRQLLATWVAHDLDHLAQISRVLAHQYRDEVGPWRAYLRIISGTPG